MRSVLALAALFGAAALASSQEGRPKAPEQIPPRYGVPFRVKAYSQATPQQALEAVITAADKADTAYLIAHLLEPGFIDTRVGDRARQIEPAVEAELGRLRDFQQKNLDRIEADARIPVDVSRFRELAAANARAAAFRQLVQDVQAKLLDDPEVMRDLRRFNREGTFPDAGAGDTVKVGLPDVRDRAVFLKKIGDRWYVENRQVDEKAPEPKEPEPKKEPGKKE